MNLRLVRLTKGYGIEPAAAFCAQSRLSQGKALQMPRLFRIYTCVIWDLRRRNALTEADVTDSLADWS